MSGLKVKWKSVVKKISELKINPRNPRRLIEKGMKDLGESINRFGLAEPIVINLNNNIIGGHARYYHLTKIGETECDCKEPSRLLTPDEERELNLRLNRNVAGVWDWDIISSDNETDELKEWGFEDWEMDLDKMPYINPEEEEAPDVRETDIKPGDMFQLGNHKLLCGDATKDIENLMQGEKADMVFTDPPYGVAYADKNKFLNSIGKGNKIEKPIEADNLSVDGMGELWLNVFSILRTHLAEYNSYYICSPQGGELLLMMMMMQKSGMAMRHMIIWAKNNHVLGRTDYNSVKGNIVLDVFGGSGSTLIACEKTDRKCYMMEIDQQYCQVIIDRWEKLTGKKAVKLTR